MSTSKRVRNRFLVYLPTTKAAHRDGSVVDYLSIGSDGGGGGGDVRANLY